MRFESMSDIDRLLSNLRGNYEYPKFDKYLSRIIMAIISLSLGSYIIYLGFEKDDPDKYTVIVFCVVLFGLIYFLTHWVTSMNFQISESGVKRVCKGFIFKNEYTLPRENIQKVQTTYFHGESLAFKDNRKKHTELKVPLFRELKEKI